MLTDDDLTRDLRAAFRDTTEDLSYDGAVPAGPHTPAWARAGWVALPAAAAVAATVVVVGGSTGDVTTPPSAAPSGTPTPSTGTPSAGSSDTAEPELVTDEFEVMGMTLSRQRGPSDPPMTISLFQPDRVPDGAREVTFPGMAPARAWVTTEDGRGVLYLDAPTRNEGRLMALTSPGLDEDDLVDLLRHGSRD